MYHDEYVREKVRKSKRRVMQKLAIMILGDNFRRASFLLCLYLPAPIELKDTAHISYNLKLSIIIQEK